MPRRRKEKKKDFGKSNEENRDTSTDNETLSRGWREEIKKEDTFFPLFWFSSSSPRLNLCSLRLFVSMEKLDFYGTSM